MWPWRPPTLETIDEIDGDKEAARTAGGAPRTGIDSECVLDAFGTFRLAACTVIFSGRPLSETGHRAPYCQRIQLPEPAGAIHVIKRR
jgi:hypothetical protein